MGYKKKNIVRDKSYAFALRILKLGRYLQDKEREYIISKQLIRSGTAPGALIREAEQAESKKDFIHKLSIGLKEINESIYWLELLEDSDYLEGLSVMELKEMAVEIIKLLTSIIKTSKFSANVKPN